LPTWSMERPAWQPMLGKHPLCETARSHL